VTLRSHVLFLTEWWQVCSDFR